MTVRIVTDSACDLTDEEATELGIEVVSLSIRFGQDEYIDRTELDVDGFYKLLADSDELPETAAPSPGQFNEAYQRLVDDGATAIVCVNLSAQLSATMQSAQTAADNFTAVPVHVVDSGSITAGLGSMVISSAKLAAEGADADAIVANIEAMRKRTRVFGALDTLDNLKKGGRIGGAAALLGTMLSVKPIVDLSSGAVEEAGKQRTRGKALKWLRDKLLEFENVENLAIMHGKAPDVDEMVSLLAPHFDVDKIRISPLGAVIGTHGGPRVMGLAFQADERRD
ncbi:MAG: DegV family protein [Acidimicrobiales bacterium]|nr:DegV family protein [Acidimicrobiales bacterium]